MMKAEMPEFRKNNHYVPQLYLKQWATEDRIQTYRLLVPRANIPLWKKHSLRGIASHQHLYTYLIGQEETDEFERWLAQEFENPATEAIRRAVNNERMTAEHWKALIRFTVAQDVRTPASLVNFLSRQQETLPSLINETLENSVRVLEEMARTGARPPTPQPTTSGAFPFKVTTERNPNGEGDGTIRTEMVVGRSLWLWSLRHLLTETIKKVPDSRWTIIHAPDGISWPTTDHPVVKLRYMSADSYTYGGGWGVPKCDVFMPLSPKHLLHHFVGRRSWPRGAILDVVTAQRIRRIIIEHAHRYVFDKEESDVPRILPRRVSLADYQQEQATWKNWHREQSEAEMDFSK
ncbi:DUF4238 domain-containing protein [Bordetella avium]|uniref:DUF4238 domain-containing protein n=1 Tax=Bordetella avium TaxID=521 RepID=UPI000E697DB4|nr:DUF4238 domain-containing protein [Bordetella avium]RIQ72041.1 DUF4238 domain-containing protein [Bordetella avium]